MNSKQHAYFLKSAKRIFCLAITTLSFAVSSGEQINYRLDVLQSSTDTLSFYSSSTDSLTFDINSSNKSTRAIVVHQQNGNGEIDAATLDSIVFLTAPTPVDLGLTVEWGSLPVGSHNSKEYGRYFSWGETSTKNRYSLNTAENAGLAPSELKQKGIIDSTSGQLTPEHDVATLYASHGWRTPSEEELKDLISYCDWKWTEQNGVKGYSITGTCGGQLFLPANGRKNAQTSQFIGEQGFYWSSNTRKQEGAIDGAMALQFDAKSKTVTYAQRYFGFNTLFVRDAQRSIQLTKKIKNLFCEYPERFEATVYPDWIAQCREIQWSTSSDSIATFDENGVLHGHLNGLVMVYAYMPGVGTDSFQVRVIQKYVDLGLSVKWASMNIGAELPEDHGDYFAWGETNSKLIYDWDSYLCKQAQCGLPVDSLSGLPSIDSTRFDAATVIRQDGCRMPTFDELKELQTKCKWTWTDGGYNVQGPNGAVIFFPAAGNKSGMLTNLEGISGYYWCATPATGYPDNANYMVFYKGSHSMYNGARSLGYTIRPVKMKDLMR